MFAWLIWEQNLTFTVRSFLWILPLLLVVNIHIFLFLIHGCWLGPCLECFINRLCTSHYLSAFQKILSPKTHLRVLGERMQGYISICYFAEFRKAGLFTSVDWDCKIKSSQPSISPGSTSMVFNSCSLKIEKKICPEIPKSKTWI